jgi:hypothetical protein
MRGSEKINPSKFIKEATLELMLWGGFFCVVLKPDILLFKVLFRLKYNRTKTLIKWMCDP